jgi:hypothetical protein
MPFLDGTLESVPHFIITNKDAFGALSVERGVIHLRRPLRIRFLAPRILHLRVIFPYSRCDFGSSLWNLRIQLTRENLIFLIIPIILW